jgi:hypothetical protein
VGAEGREHPADSPENPQGSQKSGAESGALSGKTAHPAPAGTTPGEPDLQTVIDAWPKLPSDVRRSILAAVTGHASTTNPANNQVKP